MAKKERMERLIASIDDILRGENRMDFSVFTKQETEEMFQTMVERMPEQIKGMAVSEFGSIEEWRKHYLEVMSSEKMQENYAKVIEWYGSKDAFLEAAGHPVSREVVESFGKRVDSILRKLMERKNLPRDSFEFKEPVAEYGFVMKMLYQIKDEKPLMQSVAQSYRDPLTQKKTDEIYGDGAAEYFAEAIELFHKK